MRCGAASSRPRGGLQRENVSWKPPFGTSFPTLLMYGRAYAGPGYAPCPIALNRRPRNLLPTMDRSMKDVTTGATIPSMAWSIDLVTSRRVAIELMPQHRSPPDPA